MNIAVLSQGLLSGIVYLARAKSEALFNIYTLLKENIKSCNRPLKLVCSVFPNNGPREFHPLSFHNL